MGGASNIEQLEQNLGGLEKPGFTADDLEEIDRYATDNRINIWARNLGWLGSGWFSAAERLLGHTGGVV